MRKVVVGLLGAAMVTSVGILLPTQTLAAPQVDPAPAATDKAPPVDDLPNPLEQKRRAMRTAAVTNLLSGRSTALTRNGSKVVKVGRDPATGQNQYAEVARERTDRIFVILTEFGNTRDARFPDKDTNRAVPGPTTFKGPLHNKIHKPNRAKNNSKIWQSNYSAAFFRKLYFGTGKKVESVKTYFESQSSGRYSVDGTVTDWVKVKYNEARYGRSSDDPNDANGDDPNVCASSVCANTWDLVRDAANKWVANQRAAGRTDAEITAELKSFDQYDRYDYDHDGDFNEPDGYLDHFQIVHAGGDEADGDTQQGEDAIWSHRWYAYYTDAGETGPANNKLGGTQIGNTGLWIGDYTAQPENGGLSVFVHEYTHDLGLPDDYDTSGKGDNNSEYWTLMAQSRLSAAGDQGIGTRPGDLGAWNKLQLGWLNYTTVASDEHKVVKLGPEEYNTDRPQAVVVTLPPKPVTFKLGKPYAGAKQYFSGNADNTNSSLGKTFDLTGKTTAKVTLKGRYNIEEDYDYLYAEASTDGGASWKKLDGTVNGAPFNRDGGNSPAITGSSKGSWTDIVVPLGAYVGSTVSFRLRYVSDGGVNAGGFFGDNITVTADDAVVLSDDAEGTPKVDLNGFRAVGATETRTFPNFYIAGNRSYTSYDRYLKTGPYNFGWPKKKPDWVEHYNYQPGLLISYWDTSQSDNNTNEHPGVGRNLYIDAHPKPFKNVKGKYWRARVQVYDAPFSRAAADGMKLHFEDKSSPVKGLPAAPVFNDKAKYFYNELPNHGVKLPAVGVLIKVVSQKGTLMTISVN